MGVNRGQNLRSMSEVGEHIGKVLGIRKGPPDGGRGEDRGEPTGACSERGRGSMQCERENATGRGRGREEGVCSEGDRRCRERRGRTQREATPTNDSNSLVQRDEREHTMGEGEINDNSKVQREEEHTVAARKAPRIFPRIYLKKGIKEPKFTLVSNLKFSRFRVS
eukprot:Gb_38765 [translate_table: standard]